jgi:hypothetical protein
VNPGTIAARRQAGTRAAERKAVRLYWARAERYREQNVEAANIILATPASIEFFGGQYSGLVRWSRLTLRRESARLNRLQARQVAA